MTINTEELKRIAQAATPGPWRWELNIKSKIVQLCGGRPTFDKTVMDFERWGMHGATLRLMDKKEDQFNILHRCIKWAAKVPGREHHSEWFQAIDHPDTRFMEAANPKAILELIAQRDELLDALTMLRSESCSTAMQILTAQQHADAVIARAQEVLQ